MLDQVFSLARVLCTIIGALSVMSLLVLFFWVVAAEWGRRRALPTVSRGSAPGVTERRAPSG